MLKPQIDFLNWFFKTAKVHRFQYVFQFYQLACDVIPAELNFFVIGELKFHLVIVHQTQSFRRNVLCLYHIKHLQNLQVQNRIKRSSWWYSSVLRVGKLNNREICLGSGVGDQAGLVDEQSWLVVSLDAIRYLNCLILQRDLVWEIFMQ